MIYATVKRIIWPCPSIIYNKSIYIINDVHDTKIHTVKSYFSLKEFRCHGFESIMIYFLWKGYICIKQKIEEDLKIT